MLINKCIGFRVVDESYAHARLIIIHANMCACSFHWILLIIKVDKGKVQVLDSLLKEVTDYEIVKGMVNM